MLLASCAPPIIMLALRCIIYIEESCIYTNNIAVPSHAPRDTTAYSPAHYL
jgi:hypothetical protein